jgi:hypothetical protein
MRRRAFLAVVGAALVVAGCGGNGGGGDRLTREEYASQANAICADFKRDVDALEAPQSFEGVVEYAEKARPIFDEHLGRLKDLSPPEELEDTVDRWLATGDRARQRLDDLEAAARDRDERRFAELQAELAREDRESDRLARQVGATTCAEI